MILIGGAFDFAYDAASLIAFAQQAPLDRIAFVFHPYMGPLQASDVAKSAANFATSLSQVLQTTKRPVIVTEMGQFCCASEGSCFQYPGTFNGQAMGYVRAILTELASTQMSWTAWGYRPGIGGDCTQPDLNDGLGLYQSASHSNQGANWVQLFADFYPSSVAATQPQVTVSPTTKSPTLQATKSPTISSSTTKSPTQQQSQATSTPTTKSPTLQATKSPTISSSTTKSPTTSGTKSPTLQATSTSPTTTTTSTTTNTTTTSTDSPSNETPTVNLQSKSEGGSIVIGGAIGGVGGVLAVGSAFVLFRRRRKKNQLGKMTHDSNNMTSRNPLFDRV